MLALNGTDVRILEGSPFRRFLSRPLFGSEVLATSKKIRETRGWRRCPRYSGPWTRCSRRRRRKLAISRRSRPIMKDLWHFSIVSRTDRPASVRVLEHPRFRAGYDFLQTAMRFGELDAEVGDWWRRFQTGECE